MNIWSHIVNSLASIAIGALVTHCTMEDARAQSVPFNAYSVSTLGGNCTAQGSLMVQSSGGKSVCLGAGGNGQVLESGGAGADVRWNTVSGTGTVTGPATSAVGNIALWNSTTGSAISDSGVPLPSGTIVGTSDVQTLTNKSIDGSEIDSGTVGYGFLPVGTAANTVAAGNDSRIVGALQTTGGTMTGSIGANLGAGIPGLGVSGNSSDAIYGVDVVNSGSGTATAFNAFANGLSGANGVGAGQAPDGSGFFYVQGHTYSFDKNGNLTGTANLATLTNGMLSCNTLASGTFYTSPFCFGAHGDGRTDDDNAALQASINAMLAAQAAGAQYAVDDLRGGTFSTSAALTVGTGSPFSFRFTNGAIIPFGAYTGDLIDFSAATALTGFTFDHLTLNGWAQSTGTCLHLGGKVQGSWIVNNNISQCSSHLIWDSSTSAATENKIEFNSLMGGASANSSIGIELDGYDSEVNGNIILNVDVGIKANGATQIRDNHIYSISQANPIPAIWLTAGLQTMITGNYIDASYIYVQNPSRQQINDNKWLNQGGPSSNITTPSGFSMPFSGIILAPGSSSYDMFDMVVVGNNFDNEGPAGPYNPVGVDTKNGTITSCQNTQMADNGFSGYNPMYTSIWKQATASALTALSYDMTAWVPWCSLTYIKSYYLEKGWENVTGTAISGDVATINVSSAYTGTFGITATVNASE